MTRFLAIKTNEPGFDQVIVLCSVLGFLVMGVVVWVAWRIDSRAAKENRKSKFPMINRMINILVIVAIIALVISILLPSVERYRPAEEGVRVVD